MPGRIIIGCLISMTVLTFSKGNGEKNGVVVMAHGFQKDYGGWHLGDAPVSVSV